jgi:hypothetical protein
MRWGELTEVRVGDLDFAIGILTVSRAVVELAPDEHPDGGRFMVKDYPKDKEYRRFRLSRQITANIQTHVTANGIGDDDLLFSYQAPEQHRARLRGAVGMTEPNEKGRQYRHGTLTAYNAAKCRANIAAEHMPPTALHGAPAARTNLASRASGTQMAISQPTGSTIRCGVPPERHAGWARSEFMTCGMRTLPSCWLESPICKS